MNAVQRSSFSSGQALMVHKDLNATVIDARVLNKGGCGVRARLISYRQ
jgi:hypothetical protein